MTLLSFKQYLACIGKELKEDERGMIPASEFDRAKIPIIVECSGCSMTMPVVAALIEWDTRQCFCSSCARLETEEPNLDNSLVIPGHILNDGKYIQLKVTVLKKDIMKVWPEIREAFTNMIPDE